MAEKTTEEKNGNESGLVCQRVTLAVFVAIIGGLFILCRAAAPVALLQSERREPARFPALTTSTIASAVFMDRFENYAADNFVFREGFRRLRSAFVFGALQQSDKNGLYLDAYSAGEFKPINPGSIEQLTKKIQTAAAALNGANVFYSYIPDKSIYSNKELPGFDSTLAERLLTEAPGMGGYTFVDLVGALDAGSFYRTDLHWRQTELQGVLAALGQAMGFDVDLNEYSEGYAGELHGVYSGQIALQIGTDDIGYLSCPSLSASYLNEKTMELEPGPVYDWDKLTGLDAYDFFLSGAQPLIILENREAASDKELYLFRDSFSSSLAPLLAGAYSKIVLIDLRYINMRTLNRYVEFKPGSDALFLYSTLVLNNSGLLLIT